MSGDSYLNKTQDRTCNAFKFNNQIPLELGLKEERQCESNDKVVMQKSDSIKNVFIGRKFMEKPLNSCLANLLFRNSDSGEEKENRKVHTQNDLIQHALEYNNYALEIFNDLIRKAFSKTKFTRMNGFEIKNNRHNLGNKRGSTKKDRQIYRSDNLPIENPSNTCFSTILKSQELVHGLLALYDNLYKLSGSCDAFTEKYNLNDISTMKDQKSNKQSSSLTTKRLSISNDKSKIIISKDILNF